MAPTTSREARSQQHVVPLGGEAAERPLFLASNDRASRYAIDEPGPSSTLALTVQTHTTTATSTTNGTNVRSVFLIEPRTHVRLPQSGSRYAFAAPDERLSIRLCATIMYRSRVRFELGVTLQRIPSRCRGRCTGSAHDSNSCDAEHAWRQDA